MKCHSMFFILCRPILCIHILKIVVLQNKKYLELKYIWLLRDISPASPQFIDWKRFSFLNSNKHYKPLLLPYLN